jgi:uncharacterized protein (TIGR01244 family)
MALHFIRALCLAALIGASTGLSASEAPLTALPNHVALSERLHVSGQPSLEDIARLRTAGISTVIDLRPDGETPDLDERAAVEAAGLRYLSLPIANGADLTPENVRRFDQLLGQTANGNVLLHCASGNRVGALLALRSRWIDGKTSDESLTLGKKAGLTGLSPTVQKLLEAPVPALPPVAPTPRKDAHD